jgi:hypothetical protein
MANLAKGEVGFQADGKAYTLVLDIDALCLVEERLNMSALRIMAIIMTQPQLRYIKLLLWAGLQAHHKGLTESQAGELIVEIGGVVGAADLINRGFAATFPTPEAAEGAGDPPPPAETPEDGTGSGSTASGLN